MHFTLSVNGTNKDSDNHSQEIKIESNKAVNSLKLLHSIKHLSKAYFRLSFQNLPRKFTAFFFHIHHTNLLKNLANCISVSFAPLL